MEVKIGKVHFVGFPNDKGLQQFSLEFEKWVTSFSASFIDIDFCNISYMIMKLQNPINYRIQIGSDQKLNQGFFRDLRPVHNHPDKMWI